MSDRKRNNRRLRDIIQQHRREDGSIAAIDIAVLQNDLIALLDECVEEALAEGVQQ